MLIQKPILQPMARDAMDRLAKDGIVCAPDEVLWLQEMAARVIHPTRADELLYLNLPVPCGNTLFWPLSIGARLWLKTCKPWFQGTDLEDLAFAFAMAHSRSVAAHVGRGFPVAAGVGAQLAASVFADLTSPFLARLRVAKWAGGLTASRAELDEAVARCVSPEDYDLVEVKGGPAEKKATTAPSAADYGDVISLLCYFYHQPPEYWLWETSEDQCADLLNKVAHLLPPDRKITSDSAKFRAHAQFLAVVAHIRKSRLEGETAPSAAKGPLAPLRSDVAASLNPSGSSIENS